MSNTQALMRPHAVARRLGLSAARVRQMDDELKPVRTDDGFRLYHPDEVERVAAAREDRRTTWRAFNAKTRGKSRDGRLVLEFKGLVHAPKGTQWRIPERNLSGAVAACEHVGREVYGHDHTLIAVPVGDVSTGLFLRGLSLGVELLIG